MKNLITNAALIALFASIMSCALPTNAQIVITSDNVPSAGTNYIKGIDEMPLGIDPGEPGPGQVWNFSSLVADATIGYAYEHPLATPYPSQFPEANLVLHTTDTAYSYLYFDEDIFDMEGNVIEFEGDPYTFDYTPDMIILNFPFVYGDEISQNYYFEYIFTSNNDTIRLKTQVTKSLEADAFGVVSLEAGSFNALRATVHQVAKDSTWAQVLGNWMLISSTISTFNSYEWYTDDNDVDILLVSLRYDESWITMESAEYFRNSYVGLEDQTNKAGIDLYPNPSSGKLFIETNENPGSLLQVINASGELVIEQGLSSNIEEIDIIGLKPGIYFCMILDDRSRRIYQEKIVIK